MMTKTIFLMTMALMGSNAFAGRSAVLLECTGPRPAEGFSALEFQVFYEFPEPGFRPAFVGFSADSSDGGQTRLGYYCNGACEKLDRAVVGDRVTIKVGQDITLSFDRSLAVPGTKANAYLDINLERSSDETHARYSQSVECEAQTEAAHLFDTGT